MAIKNTKLGGVDFSTPTARIKPTDLNDTNNAIANVLISNSKGTIRNLIRQLQDRAVSFSGDGGEWAEAYSDSNGRLNSVDTTLTEALFSINKYAINPASNVGATTVDTGSGVAFATPDNAFDLNPSSVASADAAELSTYPRTFGKTFASKYIGDIRIKASILGGAVNTKNIKLQTYDGTSWTTVTTLVTNGGSGSASYDDTYTLNATVQGIALLYEKTGSNNDVAGSTRTCSALWSMNADEGNEEVITHDIPSGSFSDTISSCIGSALVEDWEDGSDIQFKLTNTTEDTGWLNVNEISSFTAFTSEPTKCIVKLIPKTTSPTTGFPSILGFGVVE